MEGEDEGATGAGGVEAKANTEGGQGWEETKAMGEGESKEDEGGEKSNTEGGVGSKQADEEEEEEMTEYEQQRQANIRRNKDILAGTTSQPPFILKIQLSCKPTVTP